MTSADSLPSLGFQRLERFLDSTLQPSLEEALAARDRCYNEVSSCAQLEQLLDEMRALSRYGSFIAPATAAHEDIPPGGAPSSSSPPRAMAGVPSLPHASPRDRQYNHLLVDIGHNFYVKAVVPDSTHLHVNVGCGVVLKMDLEQATRFVKKRAQMLRERARHQTREVLRLKYRMRVVSETIARLHEQTSGMRRA